MKEPATEPVHESVEEPELAALVKTILVGVRVQDRPVEGETVVARVTVPMKPLTAVTVMVEVPAEPTVTLTLLGLAAIVKSGAEVTLKVTVAD
jgi:hypothetical protein